MRNEKPPRKRPHNRQIRARPKVRILISGVCGFAGHAIAESLASERGRYEILGVDNLIRSGSETNRTRLKALGIQFIHADLRAASDVDPLPGADWVIDAAANPSVLAGVDAASSSRQLVEHNLGGTINLLEYCRRQRAGFIMLSSSRVYSIEPLATMPVRVNNGAFEPAGARIPGLGPQGISEEFSTQPPLSLYGATKLASETLALEYGGAFGLPVFINRCGILAGAGQFGRPDQGIFTFWIHSYLRRRPLRYIGFGGRGHQVRDCLHPRDLVPLLLAQMDAPSLAASERVVNVGGGVESALSLNQLSRWCSERFGPHPVRSDSASRRFDLPWVVLDSSKAKALWK